MNDSIKMRTEADCFLAGMPAGLQQKQSIAIEDALEGKFSLLKYVRNSRNHPATYSENVSVEDILIQGKDGRDIPMRLYIPATEDSTSSHSLLIYLHGGGWTFGSLNSCARYCDAIASTANIKVLAVDYSLAPEHPYPEGLQDCIEAVNFAINNSQRLDIDVNSISIGGDSSGGNLALATAIRFIRNGYDPFKSIVVYYPVVKAETDSSDSWIEYGDGYGLDSGLMNNFIKAYHSACPADEIKIVSPAYATEDVLKKFPPVLMINAERDILRDQCYEFAKSLSEAGTTVEHLIFPGTVHLFITVSGQETAFSNSIHATAKFLNQE